MLVISILSVLLLLIYIFPVVQVCGDSMYPTFRDGDILLGCRLFRMKVEGIYVYIPPEGDKHVIKRLVHKIGHHMYFVGDNRDYSYDSREYGYISRDKVVAKYLFTIRRGKECNDNGNS